MIHINRSLPLVGLCVLGGLLGGPVPDACAKKILLILSRSIEPFTTIGRGIERSTESQMEAVSMDDMAKGQEAIKVLSAATTDALICIGSEAMAAARNADADIPVIYTLILDKVETPRKNLSGVEVKLGIDAQLAKISSLFPSRKRIGVLYCPEYSNHDVGEAREQAGQYGQSILSIPVVSESEIPEAVKKFSASSVDVIWVMVDRIVANPNCMMVQIRHAAEQRLPLVGFSKSHAKGGAVVALSIDYADVGVQVAGLTKEVVASGVSRIEKPRKIDVFVNRRVQQELALSDMVIPPEAKFIEE